MSSSPFTSYQTNRIVAAYLDGRRQKGYVLNFSPLKETFRLFPNETAQQESGIDISLRDLKALFFVRDFAGNPNYIETAIDDGPKHGRQIIVTFSDGEELSRQTDRSLQFTKTRFLHVPGD